MLNEIISKEQNKKYKYIYPYKVITLFMPFNVGKRKSFFVSLIFKAYQGINNVASWYELTS